MNHPIYVPSKGRANNAAFIKLLQEQNIRAYIVVEKEDYLGYVAKYPLFDYIILPASNKGITFVRNFIKQHAQGYSYWMVDDDVSQIYQREGTKLNRVTINELDTIADNFIALNKPGICSLEYRQFAWSATKPYVKDSFCDSFVFINNQFTKDLYYDQGVEGKEDRDFAMQCIKSGLHTYRTTEYAFSAPPNGSNAGGLKEIFYDAGREEQCALNMVAKWGEHICTKIIKEDGRHDVKINWSNIKSNSLF